MAPFLVAHAADADWRVALREAARHIERQRRARRREHSAEPDPTLGFVYLSDGYAPQAQALLDALRERWPALAWVGAVGVGISATGVEYFGTPALSLMLAALPRESFRDLWGQYVRFGRWKTRYWVTRGEAPRPRQYALLAGPVVVVMFMLGLLRRHPGVAVATAIAGAVALDVTGVDEPASPAIRVGGILASVTAAAGWWWGVISGWVRS